MELHTVTEIINGVANAPTLYTKKNDADRCFADLVKENGAKIHQSDPYKKVADCSPAMDIKDDYLVVVHYNVPIND